MYIWAESFLCVWYLITSADLNSKEPRNKRLSIPVRIALSAKEEDLLFLGYQKYLTILCLEFNFFLLAWLGRLYSFLVG
jgi:hypothetical protein